MLETASLRPVGPPFQRRFEGYANSNFNSVYDQSAVALAYQGLLDEAVIEGKHAAELDPLSPQIPLDYLVALTWQGKYQMAREANLSPIAVAQTRRLHSAKKLIDETNLPMYQVPLASGFGCVRRFNAGISNVYHRTPTQIRWLARRTDIQPDNHYLFRLHFRPPLH